MNLIQIPGVVKYVRHAGKPAVIRDQHIKALRKLIKSDTTFEVAEKNDLLGSEIEIQSGPFRGMKGHVKEIRGNKKLIISLESIEYTVIVELPEN